MPLYLEVVEATHDTVAKLLANRNQVGTVTVTTEGGASASMRRIGGNMVLNLPTMAPDARLSRAEADRIVGYVVHEVAHQLHTNWTEWMVAARASGMVRDLTNALEDLRIERLENAGLWGGFRTAMQTLVRHMDDTAQTDAAKAGHTIGATAADMPWLVALLGRVDVLGLDIPGAERTRRTVAPALRPVLALALAKAGSCTSCADCHALAVRVAAMLRQLPASLPPAQPGQGAEGQDAEGQGAEGQGAEGQDAEGQGAGMKGAPSPDATRAGVSASLSPGRTQAPAEDNRAHCMLCDATGYDVDTRSPDARALDAAAATAARALLPNSAKLRAEIGRLVTAQEIRHLERHLAAGRFDRRAVARAAVGCRNVYARRHDTPGVNTAVTLLVDLSSSMDTHKMRAARTLALVLARTIDQAGADVSVMGFVSSSMENHGCDLVEFMAFGSSLARAEARLAGMDSYGSSTPLSPAIIAASRRLIRVEADRHLLCILTDGICDYGNYAVRVALRTVGTLGVRPFGIGCDFDLAPSFDGAAPYVNVHNLAKLAQTGLGAVLAQLDVAA